ncbi:copper resistance protein CopC [Halalkalibacterium halodurans]|uniref:copper resistance CopC family protein n=1 Tax=Halalkalibacterium halodurans TaxID=86665 RepID=UPI001067D9D7|nr:copper resistance CopC family protein [Halalkalibacterium halodurans]TES47058.1 copper resistance protein CopC [Halalkalibacterium halodurans]
MKKTLLLLIICLLLFPNLTFAHTSLVSSSPSEGEVLTASPGEIVLEFNTKVEKGSQFQVINPSDNGMAVTGISIEDKMLSGMLPQELQGGEYQIHWKIIGADGHPIEGEVSFTVKIEQEKNSNEESNQIINKDEQSMEEDPVVVEIEPANPPAMMSTIAIILAILAIVSFFYVIRKGKIQ